MPPGPEPALTAIIPAFNAPGPRLQRAIASALACPQVREVIVVDDGSDPPATLPPTPAAARLHRIRQANQGPSAARNAALDRLGTDFAIFLDDDDELLPGGVGAVLALALRLDAAAAVAARYELSANGAMRLRGAPPEWRDDVLDYPGRVFRPIALFGASGTLVHRRVFDAGVRFDPALRIGEDRDLLRRAAEIGPIAVCSEPSLVVAVRRAGSLTSPAHLARRIRDHLVLLDRYRDATSQEHLGEATRWLINAAARTGLDGHTWRELVAAARSRGWRIPLKARWRRAVR